MRNRGATIIIENGRVALIKRTKLIGYYVLVVE